MRCHICHEPAIGQCQRCWKFYCVQHGDVTCETCAQRKAVAGLSGAFTLGDSIDDLADSSDEEQRLVNLLGFRTGIPEAKFLRGVLAIGEVRRTDLAEISLISLESYEDGFRIVSRITSKRHAGRSADAFSGRHPNLLFGKATDDLGGAYSGGPGAGGGGPDDWRSEAMFTPAIADAATRLELRIEEIQWMSWMPNVRSSFEVGPWMFPIQLEKMQPVRREQA